jgi:hypothetical protein
MAIEVKTVHFMLPRQARQHETLWDFRATKTAAAIAAAVLLSR